jgi:3-hydroxyisobutyrate dehydrogenase-like beta-hydroxyacid dehydrogenase
MFKDLRLAGEAGAQLGLALPATRAIRDVFAEAAKTELAEADYSAVLDWLERGSPGHSAAPR